MISWADFRPGKWASHYSGDLDQTTGKVYDRDTPQSIRCKAFCFSGCGLWGIPLNALCSTGCAAGRAIRLLVCFHCWKESGNAKLTKKDRCIDAGVDCVKIIGAYPLCVVEQGTLCVTVVCPSNDMKKYAHTLDLLQFDLPEGWGLAAPCFHHNRVIQMEAPKAVEMTSTPKADPVRITLPPPPEPSTVVAPDSSSMGQGDLKGRSVSQAPVKVLVIPSADS